MKTQLNTDPKIVFDEPTKWRKTKWRKVKPANQKGIKKCKLKNRIRVGALTLKLPQTNSTNESPTIGRIDRLFVITRAA